MDFDTLVEKITARVNEKLLESEKLRTSDVSTDYNHLSSKLKILILTQDDNTTCDEKLYYQRLDGLYDVCFGQLEQNEKKLDTFEVVMIHGLSIGTLSKISAGISDSPFTSIVQKAILKGKKVVVVKDDMEIFTYASTAPKIYYNKILEKITFLEKSGVIFCNGNDINAVLDCKKQTSNIIDIQKSLEQNKVWNVDTAQPNLLEFNNTFDIDKKVITERIISEAKQKGFTSIKIGKKSIVTELAKEYAEDHNIQILRK